MLSKISKILIKNPLKLIIILFLLFLFLAQKKYLPMGADVSSIHLKSSKCLLRKNQLIFHSVKGVMNCDEKDSLLVLNDDCLRHIFHRLALYDLNAIGKTCKRLSYLAGDHFARYYSSKNVVVRQIGRSTIEETVDGVSTFFGPFAQQLKVYHQSWMDEGIFRYIASNINHDLKSIQFNVRKTQPVHGECIKKTLNNVKMVKFFHRCDDSQYFENILKHCSKIQSLSLHGPKWPKQTFPTLECLEVFDKDNGSIDELREFLSKNLQIKKLTTAVRLSQFSELIEDFQMDLDELGFTINKTGKLLPLVINKLNRLYDMGAVKRIKLICDEAYDFYSSRNEILQLRGLTSIKIIRGGFPGDYRAGMQYVITVLSKMTSLTELHLVNYGISLDQAGILAGHLKNLENVHFEREPIHKIIPFVSSVPKLKTARVGKCYLRHKISIQELNMERKELINAQKITIYVPDGALLRLKQTSTELDHEFMIFRRIENHTRI